MKDRKTRFSSLRELREAKGWFKDHPEGTVKVHGLWPEVVYTKDQWEKWFMDCLNRKINREGPPRGRKESYEWQIEIRRASREINHPRLIIHWLPPDLKKRFAYRLRENMI